MVYGTTIGQAVKMTINQKRIKPFIFITGDIIGEETRHFLSEAGLPYLTKPFDLAEVKNTVNRILAAVG